MPLKVEFQLETTHNWEPDLSILLVTNTDFDDLSGF